MSLRLHAFSFLCSPWLVAGDQQPHSRGKAKYGRDRTREESGPCKKVRAVKHRLGDVETLMQSTSSFLLFFFLLSLPYLTDLGILLISRLDLDVVRKHDAKKRTTKRKREERERKRRRLPPFFRKNAGRTTASARFSLSLSCCLSSGRDAREGEAREESSYCFS